MKITITKVHFKISLIKIIRENLYCFGCKADTPLNYIAQIVNNLPLVSRDGLGQFTVDELVGQLTGIANFTVEADPDEEWDEEANQPWLKEAKAWFDQLSDIEKYYVEQLGRHWNRGPS